jgi:NAD(P)H dehydrogenase (quinone)
LDAFSLIASPLADSRSDSIRRLIPSKSLPAILNGSAFSQRPLISLSTPADRTGLYIEMVKSFNSGWIHFGNSGTEKFHGPTTIEAFAQELVK